MTPTELKDLCIAALEALKGRDIVVLDVKPLTDMADFMVFCTGTSSRHVKSLADNVEFEAKKLDVRAFGVEGQDTGEWVLVDFGDVVVHVMQSETRAFYDLERLWSVSAAPSSPPGDAG